MGFNQVGRIYQNINILNLSRIKQTIDDKVREKNEPNLIHRKWKMDFKWHYAKFDWSIPTKTGL